MLVSFSHPQSLICSCQSQCKAWFCFFISIFLIRLTVWCCSAGYVQMKRATACALWVSQGLKGNRKLIDPKGNADGFKRNANFITSRVKMELTFAESHSSQTWNATLHVPFPLICLDKQGLSTTWIASGLQGCSVHPGERELVHLENN